MTRPLVFGLHLFLGDELASRKIDGILRYAQMQEIGIREFNYMRESDESLHAPPLWRGKVDGVISSRSHFPGIIDWLQAGGVPFVNQALDLFRLTSSVYVDPPSLARLATKHLLQFGYRRFAFVGSKDSYASQIRAEAIIEVLAEQQIVPEIYHTTQVFQGTFEDFDSLDEIEKDLLRLIRDAPKPIGIIALNDHFATTICRIALNLGLQVPKDVAVVGVNDVAIARISTPTITSIRFDCEKLGYESAKLLHQMVLGKVTRKKSVKITDLELIERQSTVGMKRAGLTDVPRALEYIREKACEAIRVDDIAAAVNVPRRTFEMEFMAQVGHTVGAEIRRVKLDRVKTLLETTDFSLSTIARLTGMNDASYLNNFFRRLMNVTPMQYRTSRQNAGDINRNVTPDI